MQLISQVSFRAIYEHGDWTLDKLSQRSGVNRSTIGHLLSGKRDTCLSRNAKAIAKALGVPTDALFRAERSTVAPTRRRSKGVAA